jgi:hypothetical protein
MRQSRYVPVHLPQWCLRPVHQSGPDIASHTRWLPAVSAEHAEQIAGPFDVGRDASHSKKTNLSAQYRRLAGRRGKKRAIVALGHTMLVMILVKRLESLGDQVTLGPVDRAA